jgi:putative SOS response-associated peptidase YedK
MCGRYVSVSSPSLLASHFGAEEVRTDDADANYNVTPRAEVPIVAMSGETRVVDRVRWGLVPWFAKDVAIGDKLINARSETITTKPAYRRAFERRRCIIPADGFYEWKKVPGQKAKQPYFIQRADGEPLAFAGLWEVWRPKKAEGEEAAEGKDELIRSCTIITGEPNEKMAEIHDRMPVMLPPSAWAEWLDPENDDLETLGKLLVPAPASLITMHPVSTAVNNARSKGAELADPIDPEDADRTL